MSLSGFLVGAAYSTRVETDNLLGITKQIQASNLLVI